MFKGVYKGVSTVNGCTDSRSYIDRPHGAFYGFCDGSEIYPFFYHPKFKIKPSTVFSESETVYKSEEKGLVLEMRVRAEHNAEIRTFGVKNKSRTKKQLTLCLYSEPTLAAEADYSAHPMFMDLFLKIEYDKENKLFVFYRKERDGNKVTACAAGFSEEDADFTYCFSKEACLGSSPFSFFDKALLRECYDRAIPSPCLFVKDDMTVDAGETKKITFFYCYADSAEEAKKAALRLRSRGGELKENFAPSQPFTGVSLRLLCPPCFTAKPRRKLFLTQERKTVSEKTLYGGIQYRETILCLSRRQRKRKQWCC